MGNGDEQSGDGYRFRGRGTIQLTGRENYTLFFKSIGEPLQEDRVSKDLAIQSAGWFWDTKNINEKIDRGADVVAVTKIVNGGRNGLADRMKKTQEILSVITS
jgi:putative chitinase